MLPAHQRASPNRKTARAPVADFQSARGLSQEELAFECGLDRTLRQRRRARVRNPTVVVLEKIAKALKVATSLLLE